MDIIKKLFVIFLIIGMCFLSFLYSVRASTVTKDDSIVSIGGKQSVNNQNADSINRGEDAVASSSEDATANKGSQLFHLEDIVNTALGAFLGFGFSILLDRMATSAKKRKSIDNIKSEFRSISDGLDKSLICPLNEKLKNKINDMNEANEIRICTEYSNLLSNEDIAMLDGLMKNVLDLSYVIYYPVWNSICSNGDLLEFKDEKYFDELIASYTIVIHIQKLVDYFSENFNGINDNDKLTYVMKIVCLATELKGLIAPNANTSMSAFLNAN